MNTRGRVKITGQEMRIEGMPSGQTRSSQLKSSIRFLRGGKSQDSKGTGEKSFPGQVVIDNPPVTEDDLNYTDQYPANGKEYLKNSFLRKEPKYKTRNDARIQTA
ncbi:hypothetical protein C922_05211 [Plasmodium inui San Antonio 1]|uniref:Uncharacterized protein n=1 Tax=Plasmodium inui San Antonio 1 TaxID=1237626 RepID=W6ZTZ2_9APIC|nr:hypothetical protein C922_05211 [Plasmodium inui San Antonio 1]EUD64412.1 hypothetical protein C922_05211 [Plasmodium inui San Antonio 1]